MEKEISKEELIARGVGEITKLFPYVKELKEITNDFGEVNRLLNENWILVGVVSNSGNVKHVMGRLELN